MNSEYIITNEELAIKGLDLNDYAIEGDKIPAIINICFDEMITEILYLNDNFSYEEDIENALDENSKLVAPFKKLQYRVIYNMIFNGDDDPIDKKAENIIVFDLRWGKINGFQKGIFGNKR